jgi:hypothetical protein
LLRVSYETVTVGDWAYYPEKLFSGMSYSGVEKTEQLELSDISLSVSLILS